MNSLALSYAVNLLARREYSEFELRNKMQEKAFSDEEIDQVIAHCQQKNWQNDQRFSENYIRYRAQRGYGKKRIQQELRQLKGVQNTVIEQALDEVELDWYALALQLLSKKFPNYTESQTPKQKQKIWQYMLSHGFHTDEFVDYVGAGISDFD